MKLTYVTNIKALAYHVHYFSDYQTLNSDYNSILIWISTFYDEFNIRLSNNGKKWTLSRYKSIYLWIKQYLFKIENEKPVLDPFIKTNKQGIPKELSMISHLIHEDSPWLRVIMTVIRLFESIKLEEEFDESSIVNNYSGKPLELLSKEFKSFSFSWFNRFGKRIKDNMALPKLASHELSYRFKSGPMGPSILTAHLDSYVIKNNKELLSIFMGYCTIVQSWQILRIFEHSNNMIEKADNQSSNTMIPGRISLVSESAGKTRLFAICNFWIQSLLKPLHDQLMLSLKVFESDGTYNQIEQFQRLIDQSKNHPVYCYDLSKATDRFPIELQKVILGVLVSEEFADRWSELIGNIPYHYKGKPFYWKVGQPLGAFSSWAIFSLTHHLVVQFCYFKAYKRIRWFNKYSLLGDDIGIWDTKVAYEYQLFMNDIGVEINYQKSIIGKPNSGEFAKRLFLNGRNISGFGYQMVTSANASVTGWIRYLEILEQEDFISTSAPFLNPGLIDCGLPQRFQDQLSWQSTLRLSFAQRLLINNGNITFSYSNLLEYYIQERLELLYRQLSSSLSRGQYVRLTKRIVLLSKRWGLTVKVNCLDIIFIGDELVSHPIVRYLNDRNNIIFDKIETFSNLTQDNLFSTEGILSLASYSQEEFIPSMTLDTFYVQDINETKFKIKNSIQSRAFRKLMISTKSHDTEG